MIALRNLMLITCGLFLGLSQHVHAAALNKKDNAQALAVYSNAKSTAKLPQLVKGSTKSHRILLTSPSDSVLLQHNNTGQNVGNKTIASLTQELATLRVLHAQQQKEKDAQLVALQSQLAAEQQKNMELAKQSEELTKRMGWLSEINMDEIKPTGFKVTMLSYADDEEEEETTTDYYMPMNNKAREAITQFTESIQRYKQRLLVYEQENTILRTRLAGFTSNRNTVANNNRQLRRDNEQLKEQVRLGHEEWLKRQSAATSTQK